MTKYGRIVPFSLSQPLIMFCSVTLGLDSTIWQPLDKVWKGLARAHSTFWEADEEDDGRQWALAGLCATMAKFIRNLVAGVPDNQSRAL